MLQLFRLECGYFSVIVFHYNSASNFEKASACSAIKGKYKDLEKKKQQNKTRQNKTKQNKNNQIADLKDNLIK